MTFFHRLLKDAEPSVKRGWKLICKKVNDDPSLQSMLYDLDLLPEQIISPEDARKLAIICSHWKEGGDAK